MLLIFFSTGQRLSMDLQQNETSHENINTKCRPSVIAEKYQTLTFQTASTLKEHLSNADEQDWKQFLSRYICAVYMVS